MKDDFLSNHAIVAVFCPTKPTTDNKAIVPNSMELFNPSTNTWSYLTSVPGLIEGQILRGFCMVSLGDYIYIIGGLICHKEGVHVSDDSAELVDVGCSSAEVYDMLAKKWDLMAGMWQLDVPAA
ncbi:hypothetical protein PIB30_016869 [Stylosanthes scabra]|uniref:Uncharacterized protein n=1 Tax=Stylosanthes scabra TaxID=79078 RepID=A0ABU6U928_9FABA|nr:hypothetical protein [Stylosanthes scabra]